MSGWAVKYNRRLFSLTFSAIYFEISATSFYMISFKILTGAGNFEKKNQKIKKPHCKNC